MQDRVKAPAIGLIVLGSLDLVFLLFWFIGKGFVLELGRHIVPPEQFAEVERQAMTGGMLHLVGNALFVCGSAFLVFAGWQMMKLQNHALAFAGSIVAMIPCFTGCCCVVGIPLGIWSLIVLSKPDVKSAFTS